MPDDPKTWTRPRVAAGALLLDEEERVLLVRPTYKPTWDIPGGYINHGETPHEACIREIREELGLELVPTRPLVADWAPHPDEGDKLLLVFDGGTLTSTERLRISLQEEELAEHRFVTPAELSTLLIDRLYRRVTAAIQAKMKGIRGSTIYLEHGIALAR